MKMKPLNALISAVMLGGTLASLNVATAATQPAHISEFTPDNATQALTIKPDSFYNLGMGTLGWTHHSTWGYMFLKKGKQVSITAKATSADEVAKAALHPGIAVWSVPQKANKYVDIHFSEKHMYSQWQNVYVLNPPNNDSMETVKPILKGALKWDFITNGFDRDGMEGVKVVESGNTEPTDLGILPAAYDQAFINHLLDGTAGSVTVSFVPPVTGYYKFVVGGINPGAALWWTNTTTNVYEVHRTDEPVEVKVNFPQ